MEYRDQYQSCATFPVHYHPKWNLPLFKNVHGKSLLELFHFYHLRFQLKECLVVLLSGLHLYNVSSIQLVFTFTNLLLKLEWDEVNTIACLLIRNIQPALQNWSHYFVCHITNDDKGIPGTSLILSQFWYG